MSGEVRDSFTRLWQHDKSIHIECNLDVWMTNAHQSQLPDVPSALIPTNNIIPTSFALVVPLTIFFIYVPLNTTRCHDMYDIVFPPLLYDDL